MARSTACMRIHARHGASRARARARPAPRVSPRGPGGGLALAAVLLLGGCGGDSGDSEPPPSIVLITADTLRRDHLGCYGYPRDTSPNLDLVAAEGVLFERAYAAAPSTLPSHVSIFTGLHVHQHGVVSNQEGARHPFRPGPGRASFVQALRAAGYRTGAFISAAPVGAHTGLDAGFETFDGYAVRTGPRTAESALAWLDSVGDAPFFLWVHLWDAHEPNVPPRSYVEDLAADGRTSELLAEGGIDAAALPDALHGERTWDIFFPGREPEPAGDDRVRIAAADLGDLLDRYDACVRVIDDQVGRLAAWLEERGRWDGTVFAFVADHGQCLGDHAWLGHGRLDAATVRVPLVVRFPPGLVPQPARVDEPVSLTDLAPTLLARLELPELAGFLAQCEGRDALGSAGGEASALVQRGAGGDDGVFGARQALFAGRWQLQRDADATLRLFDALDDPLAREDQSAAHPDTTRELAARLERLLERRPAEAPAGPARADAERHLETLRGLGYAGDE